MSDSMALYRKWRPAEFGAVVGQEHITQTLLNAVHHNRLAHAYLFAGPRGTGKTSIARLLARAVNCVGGGDSLPCGECAHCRRTLLDQALDLVEIDAASNNGVDDVRDLRSQVLFKPSAGRFRVFLIDEVHMLSTAAFNALLKTLEEPPAHVIFILATTESEKIPVTVISRCQRFDFRLLTPTEIGAQLGRIAAAEELQVEPEALELISLEAAGSLRDALTLLDRLATPGEPLTVDRVRQVLGAVSREALFELLRAWSSRDLAGGLTGIHLQLESGADPLLLAKGILEQYRLMLLIQSGLTRTALRLSEEHFGELRRLAGPSDRNELLRCLERWTEAARRDRAGTFPGLPLEIAMARSVEESPKLADETRMPAAPKVEQLVAMEPSESFVAQLIPSEEIVRGGEDDSPSVEVMHPPDVITPPTPTLIETRVEPPSLSLVQSKWREVVQAIRTDNPRLASALAGAKPTCFEGQRLTLTFQHRYLFQQANSAQARKEIEEALGRALGGEWVVECALESATTVGLSPSLELPLPP